MTPAAPSCDEARTAAFLLESGEHAKALELAQLAILKAPCGEAFGIAAAAHASQGNRAAAVATCRTGLARFPGHILLELDFARLLRQSPDDVDEALAILTRVVERLPDFAPARLSLIETLRTCANSLEQAEQQARDYVRRHPDDGRGHAVLALTLFNMGRLSEALAAAEPASVLLGDETRGWEIKANICVALGDAPAASSCYRAMLRKRPDAEIHSRLLSAMQYCDSVDEADIFAETRRWVAAHAARIVPNRYWPKLLFDPDRPLAVGIVSSGFRLCSTPLLALPLLENAPPDWKVTLYANVEQADEWTSRFRQTCFRWVDIAGIDDEQAARNICDDAIDVLIDLDGHTLGGRLGIFARKPAPVQLAWLDYVGSTGLATFDAIVADAGHVPLSDQPWYTEPIRHVATNLYRYLPPDTAPAVAAAPALRNGYVTFGCFNSPYKLSGSALSLWAKVLLALPASRLVLNSSLYALPDTQKRFRGLLAERGVSDERIEFRSGASSPSEMMAMYNDVDMGLDPFPYSGGLTTIEALYMGVPVITKRGNRFGARHSAVHLQTVGLDDWIAEDDEDYIVRAIRKATAIAELAALRSQLRPQVSGSALLDGAGFATDFAEIVRELWLAACRTAEISAAPHSVRSYL